MSSIIFRAQPPKISSIRSQSPMRKAFPSDFKKEEYQIPKNFLPPKKQKDSIHASLNQESQVFKSVKSIWKILQKVMHLLLELMYRLWELIPKIQKIVEVFLSFLKKMMVFQKNKFKAIFARKIFKKKALYIVILEIIAIYLLLTANFKKDNEANDQNEGSNVNYYYFIYLIF